MIKAVIFDIDGVLNYSEMFSIQYQRKFGVSNDVMLPFFNQKFGKCLVGEADLKEEIKPWLKKWKWEGTAEEFLDFWFTTEDKIDKDVIQEVRRIRESGIRCFLATNQEKYRTGYLWNHNEFNKIFEAIFSSAEIGYKKKNPEFWQKVTLKLENLSKEQILFVDDDIENIHTAKNFGLHAELISSKAKLLEVLSHV